ncbi:uncharacterized protein RJT20DRAFT_4433 [Scheffersomyces xylosifermentans]|uniref:uncharacterized protein n=1 Tax=Scheffersomyces xylosifermentans TaxID=1304137 RepID=UPI00315D05AE
MLFATSAFLALISAVLAEQTFSLTATGGVEGPVTFANNALTIGNGDAPVLILEEPTGFVNIQGTSNYLQLAPGGVSVSSQSEATRNFQILNGVTFAHGPSADNAQWFACTADVGYVIKIFQDTGCEPVTLNVVGAQEQPAAEEPEATEPAPEETEATEPAPEETEATEPAPEEPEATEPAPEEPETTEPASEEPEATEPAPEEPTATEPEATEEPENTEPAPEEPEATEPAAEEPTATEPEATEEPTVPPLEGAGAKLTTGAGAIVAAAVALFM